MPVIAKVRIVIGGDLGPVGPVEDLLVKGQAREVFGPLTEVFGQADYAVANLECPLADVPTRLAKPGMNFIAGVQCAAALRDVGIDALGLANNGSSGIFL